MNIISGISAASGTLKLTKELPDKVCGELLAQINSLKTDISRRAELVDDRGLLFEPASDGNRLGKPYCKLCLVNDGLPVRLRTFAATKNTYAPHRCDNCDKSYEQ